MPNYIYGCEKKHSQEVSHLMSENPAVICVKCQGAMHRIPQAVNVNWNGLPPHLEHNRNPSVSKFINSAQQRREKYLEKKEENNG